MNLSHPEQYFSDLLSALELRPEDRRLVLMSHPVDHAPNRCFVHAEYPRNLIVGQQGIRPGRQVWLHVLFALSWA